MAVTQAQTAVFDMTGSVASLSFAGAPANGSRVVVVGGSPFDVSGTVTDSNSVALTQKINVNSTNSFLSLWEYVVSGTPTSTYSFSHNGSAGYYYGIYNLAGVVSAEYAQNNGVSPSSPLTVVIADVQNGDFLLSESWDNTSGSAGTGLTISNGSNTADVNVANVWYVTRSFATSTASTTASFAFTTADQASIFLARYTAVGGVAIPPSYGGGTSHYTGGMSA